jgi:hypothetical protein
MNDDINIRFPNGKVLCNEACLAPLRGFPVPSGVTAYPASSEARTPNTPYRLFLKRCTTLFPEMSFVLKPRWTFEVPFYVNSWSIQKALWYFSPIRYKWEQPSLVDRILSFESVDGFGPNTSFVLAHYFNRETKKPILMSRHGHVCIPYSISRVSRDSLMRGVKTIHTVGEVPNEYVYRIMESDELQENKFDDAVKHLEGLDK